MLRKICAAAAVGLAALALSACVSSGTQKLTPAQVASIVCPSAMTEVGALQSAGIFTGGAADTFTKQIAPDVAAVCASAETVTQANLTNLANVTFPLLVTVVKNSTLNDQDKARAYLAIGGLQLSINTGMAVQAAAAAAHAPGAASPLASAAS